ncbi:hypothetical protein Aspvir_009279 [Aspergillus viridinutans]|uniref:Uncharacterized protein n=1 Tax=Aspergillus viridinutans TaxID=75553 RepID=A0A9P3C4P4_ASPVI|nr:uncharacterized protein Aspvir_009279 [Aspergillus viridinutans]GIK05176.1 hypothetical protein Aspvir_009279 [Aspergillus viridinutans]
MGCRILPDFVKDMKRDPSGKGITHLGKDGVLRTLSADYEVLDARGLNPEQIQNALALFHPGVIQKKDFRDVDGTKVTSQEELFHPAPGILPTKPSEEEAAERRRLVKQSQEAYLQAKRKDCAELE